MEAIIYKNGQNRERKRPGKGSITKPVAPRQIKPESFTFAFLWRGKICFSRKEK
jgi:hypothetical protein